MRNLIAIVEAAQETIFDWTPGGGSRTRKIGDATIIYGVSSDLSTAELISLRTTATKRKNGAARAALEAFLREADALNLSVTLLASPLDKRTHLNRLVPFYQSFGFELTGRTGNHAGSPIMVRPPK
jgi:GNAT superfamily N-acetyltransferase